MRPVAAILQTLHDTVVKNTRNQDKGVPYHAGFLPHTYLKEFGCGATSYVKLHCKYILYIIYGFNILYEILVVEETSIGTDNPMHWGAGGGGCWFLLAIERCVFLSSWFYLGWIKRLKLVYFVIKAKSWEWGEEAHVHDGGRRKMAPNPRLALGHRGWHREAVLWNRANP